MRCLIFGGTGTLGRAMTKLLLSKEEVESITIFSRGELNQQQMKAEFNDNRLRFVIGDIRYAKSFMYITVKPTHIFNFAALKHIDICQHNPMEAVKTNILGTENTLLYARQVKAQKYAFSSTDKAVDPINVYGNTKAICEQMVLNAGYLVFRWGNIWASRGSFVNTLIESAKKDLPVNVTSLEMTRFWMRIADACEFVWNTICTRDGGVFIPFDKIKAASIEEIINSVAKETGCSIDYKIIGNRGGEKIHERLLSTNCMESNLVDHCSAYSTRYSEDELRSFIREVING